jgi:hypothetical protein
MNCKNKWTPFIISMLLAAITPTALMAQLSSADRRQAEKMTSGILYLRIDAPCDYGRIAPMLVVTPEKADSESRIADLSGENRESVYWQFGPNDAVKDTVLRWGINSVRLWTEGAPPNNNELTIDFTGIKTLEDYKKAFDRTFSKVPLQDAHPEWPFEIRTAVAKRLIVAGMTKEQAGSVIGSPSSVEISVVDGIKNEIWHPRQRNGKDDIYNGKSTITHFPATLKFQEDKLIEMVPSSNPSVR